MNVNELHPNESGEVEPNAQERERADSQVEIRKQGTSFVVLGVGGQVGEITYRLADVDTWVIDHTFLDPRYRGGNIARKLLDIVVEEARAEGKKIIPSCSYALTQFKRNSEYADVWEKRA
ncbi:GNAT family N-acetyltransferase [Cohnella herbarum]|uniref:N-acetyltransferase n=1 Tax=Cohnella herbarum TaxID=2728023 RepID=A0A7Z2VNX7_9BACL|nr:GNAT family N-acetyltransferase [Cohnella herbarum]QJD86491.1 N-acetyltransferase [Cohnella herbarum]